MIRHHRRLRFRRPAAPRASGDDPDTLDAYLASLPAAPKPGETWELNPGNESFTAQVIEAPDGTICFVWCPFDEVAIRRVKGFFEGNRRKIGDAPSGADQ